MIYIVSSSMDYNECFSFDGVFSTPEKVDEFIKSLVDVEIKGSAVNGDYILAERYGLSYYLDIKVLDDPEYTSLR